MCKELANERLRWAGESHPEKFATARAQQVESRQRPFQQWGMIRSGQEKEDNH